VQGETPRLKQQQSRTIESIRTPFARRITGGTIYVDGGVHIVACTVAPLSPAVRHAAA
jgi:enoyl-[acyl-carrier-protein] reductase (NADH)